MLGLLLYILCVVICDVILSPSCTVRCPGATQSLVLLCYSASVTLLQLVNFVLHELLPVNRSTVVLFVCLVAVILWQYLYLSLIHI